MSIHPLDVRLNGIVIPKLEHADDIMATACCVDGFQIKLDDTAEYAGKNGCEMQLLKCEYSVFGKRSAHDATVTFSIGGGAMKEVHICQYVGMWFQNNPRKHLFYEHYTISAEKATKAANMSLALDRIVGSMPAWESRTLYMARVDPYLINGCEVSPDTVASRLSLLEDVQNHYLRCMLGMGKRCMLAVLASETGLEPIRYRRMILVLRYMKYLCNLPHTRLAWNALMDSLGLAKRGHQSWVSDVAVALQSLPIPVTWNYQGLSEITEDMVEVLMKKVTRSLNVDVQTKIEHSTRTRDLLTGRLQWEDDKLVHKALAFRSYLRVKIPEHRIALTRMILSGHGLAMERMRWSERYRPVVPQEWRLCRLCTDGPEDAVHAMFVCENEKVAQLRKVFLTRVFTELPSLRNKHTSGMALFRDLLTRRSLLDLFAKFAHNILQVFYAEPMLQMIAMTDYVFGR